jgi:hypothetical protein
MTDLLRCQRCLSHGIFIYRDDDEYRYECIDCGNDDQNLFRWEDY